MNLAKDMINTVRESPKREQLFKNIGEDEKIGLHPLCPTRIQQVLINYERLAAFLKHIQKNIILMQPQSVLDTLKQCHTSGNFSFRTSIAMS
ncbi:hypothetical protein PR048_012677 [Dryococelus australis]|uniref:Uncharacterized protein n=1 Tax=Dryococelus australis TaxID=614101 RepID=A0ABQ9HQ68_9NEOP|nr:hypothetical protein PR048_012677 [Dryococelus australis]